MMKVELHTSELFLIDLDEIFLATILWKYF